MTHRQTRRVDLILLSPRDDEDVCLVFGRACPSRDRETGRSLEFRAFKDVSAVNDFSGRSRGKKARIFWENGEKSFPSPCFWLSVLA